MGYSRSNALYVPRSKVNNKKYMKKAYAKKMKSVPKVSLSTKKYVKKMLHKNIENKVAPYITYNDTVITPITNTVSWGTLINLSAVWTLSQGTGEGNRLGNKVTPVKWAIRGYINNTGQNCIPGVVKMFIFKLKGSYDNPNLGAGPVDFFQNGNSSTGPTNNQHDMLREINTNKFQVYATKSFKIGSAAAVIGTAPIASNNDFKCLREFRINVLKYQKPSHLIYDDAGTNVPVNTGLYICFAFAPYDGSTKTSFSGGDMPQITYDIMAQYEDA